MQWISSVEMRRMARGSSDPYYDLVEDFDLIVSSFLQQYGIRILSNDFKQMKWEEFHALLVGISPDTPLGRMVSIRSETDKERINEFNTDQKRIWSDWRNRQAKKVNKEDAERFYADIALAFRNMAGGDDA